MQENIFGKTIRFVHFQQNYNLILIDMMHSFGGEIDYRFVHATRHCKMELMVKFRHDFKYQLDNDNATYISQFAPTRRNYVE